MLHADRRNECRSGTPIASFLNGSPPLRRTGILFHGRPLKVHPSRRRIMRPYSVGGIILIVLGVLALSIHSITYFTHEQVAGPLGFFAWDVQHPHTIFFNPFVGLIAIVIGFMLAMMPARRHA